MNVVSDKFHELAAGQIRPIDWELMISWTKELNTDLTWFTLDQSKLNGPDLLPAGGDSPIQPWDMYDYRKFKERVMEMNVERAIEFPYNVQSAIMDVKLENHDRYFSYSNSSSPIASYVLPGRPIKGFFGFTGGGVTPNFVGFTKAIPEYDGVRENTATVTAFDPLSMLAEKTLPSMMMWVNARTDEILSDVLSMLDVAPEAYSFSPGLNKIPFLFYEEGKDIGNLFKELIEAENGYLWVNEMGIIRFEPRTETYTKPTVMVFDDNNILSIAPKRTDDIYNSVYIEADVRVLRNHKMVFEGNNENGWDTEEANSDNYRIKANSTFETWINLNDPCFTMTDPVINGPDTDSRMTIVKLDGTAVTSGFSVSGYLFGDSYKLTVTNSNDFDCSISYVSLFGEPAEVLGDSPTIKYTAQNTASIEAFGEKKFEVTDNKCFGSYQNAKNMADFIIRNYSDYSMTIEMEVKGDPSLQLQDAVEIDYPGYSGIWLITKMQNSLTDSGLKSTVTAHRGNVFHPFILDVSKLNGPDILM